jgi:hypothetical protein
MRANGARGGVLGFWVEVILECWGCRERIFFRIGDCWQFRNRGERPGIPGIPGIPRNPPESPRNPLPESPESPGIPPESPRNPPPGIPRNPRNPGVRSWECLLGGWDSSFNCVENFMRANGARGGVLGFWVEVILECWGCRERIFFLGLVTGFQHSRQG